MIEHARSKEGRSKKYDTMVSLRSEASQNDIVPDNQRASHALVCTNGDEEGGKILKERTLTVSVIR